MEIRDGQLVRNETNKNAMGGTEMMTTRLYESFSPETFEPFQIISSRVRELQPDKVRILWLHDLPQDPESHHLRNGGWRKFNALVFVSHWQKQAYINEYGIPYDMCHVINNAIDPINPNEKNTDQIRLIYHTTPHRGLDISVSAVNALGEKYGDRIHFDVYSSFNVYGWGERDKEYAELFDFVRDHPYMTYHGSVPNAEVREALKDSHIYTFPSTWPETFGISLVEAMSARCIVAHPDLAALPEIASKFTAMYGYQEDKEKHFKTHLGLLDFIIDDILNNGHPSQSDMAKVFADSYYGWDGWVKKDWEVLLGNAAKMPIFSLDTEVFSYET